MPKKSSNTDPTEQHEPARTEVVTAFLSYQLPDGRWHSTNDLGAAERLSLQRLATPDDFVGGAQVAIKDITALESAMNVIAQLNRVAAQQIQTTKT